MDFVTGLGQFVTSFVGSLSGPWGWVIAGLLLLALELFAPGAFMMWFGLAALAVGFIAVAVAPSWQVSAVLFAAFASLFVLIGRRIAVRRATAEDHLRLNERASHLVGHVFVLSEAIEAGQAASASRIRAGASKVPTCRPARKCVSSGMTGRG